MRKEKTEQYERQEVEMEWIKQIAQGSEVKEETNEGKNMNVKRKIKEKRKEIREKRIKTARGEGNLNIVYILR